MIADLVDDKLNIRLITTNVMSVFSINKDYTDTIITKLKYNKYIVNNKVVPASLIISYAKNNYNKYENIFKFVNRQKHININKFVEYLNYLDLGSLLWLHFYQLNDNDLSTVMVLIALASDKSVIILDYIDDLTYKNKLYSLIFNIGLTNKLIIIPFTNIEDAIINSSCQCYIKSLQANKIMSKFPIEFINSEFNMHYTYNISKPLLYNPVHTIIKLHSYKYSLYEYLLIFIYNIKLIFIYIYNWSNKIYAS